MYKSDDSKKLQKKVSSEPKASNSQQLNNNPSHTIAQKKENSSVNKTGMPDNVKAGIENLSGHSLDDVKVHYNSSKPAQLHAHAYTQGTDIHVGPGQEKHLPHEAWHVVQKKQGRVRPTTQMKGTHVNDDHSLEKEADVMGAKAVQMKSSMQSHGGDCGCGSCGGALQLKKGQTAQLQSKIIQRAWSCPKCQSSGSADPKTFRYKCPDCGKKVSEVADKAKFGDWFGDLTSEKRQELMRAHGSHEAHGGELKKNQGGGGKGNQHSNGQASAMKQIKEKYERGTYD